VVDRLERGLRVEDDRVECKLLLPDDPMRAARRIAGHANQVRDDRILWIIGVDEDLSPPIVGLQSDALDPADWWPPVEAKFDLEAPSPAFVHVDAGDATLLGLGFDTARLPFVIRLASENPSREVPWREGTRVRSANRFDLLKLLVPLTERPVVTVLDGRLEVVGERDDHGAGEPEFLWWHGRANLYVECQSPLVLPNHRCSGRVALRSGLELELDVTPGASNANSVGGLSFMPLPPSALLAEQGYDQVVVHGPSPIWLTLRGRASLEETDRASGGGRLRVAMQTAGPDSSMIDFDAELVPVPRDELGPKRVAQWTIRPSG
jgi:hypothetical protein